MMDPSIIVEAFVLGATNGSTEVASTAVTDSYGKLRSLLVRKFGGDAAAEKLLAKCEQDPTAHTHELTAALTNSSPTDSEALAAVARQLIDALGASRNGDSYHVDIRNSSGVVIGPNGKQTIVNRTRG